MKAAALTALCIALAAGGCEDPGRVAPPRPVSNVDVLILEVAPAPVKIDDNPDPDGLEVRVSFFQNSSDLPVTVGGELAFELFEGRLSSSQTRARKPMLVWRFDGDELPAYLTRPRGLWAYGMRLLWGDKAPKSSTVTLVARYTSSDETDPTIGSRPVLIALGAR